VDGDETGRYLEIDWGNSGDGVSRFEIYNRACKAAPFSDNAPHSKDSAFLKLLENKINTKGGVVKEVFTIDTPKLANTEPSDLKKWETAINYFYKS
jgi:hypothetical protein